MKIRSGGRFGKPKTNLYEILTVVDKSIDLSGNSQMEYNIWYIN
jgi:hypothetical protein